MLTLLLTFAASLLLGMRHATDPDHVVAVTTIVSREKSVWTSARIGAWWGVGHTLTIFLVGGAIILFKLAFTPRLGLSMELAVAVMLIVLGALNLFGVQATSSLNANMRPFAVGLVHGLAGSAAATLLILPLIPDPKWALVYLVVFGAGTIAGMAIITFAIAAPSVYVASRVQRVQHWIRMASGGVSVAFGLFLVYQIGFVDGLFTMHPNWTPR